jgi:hypothetical protein
MPDTQRAEMCQKALEASDHNDERILALAVLERYPNVDTLKVARRNFAFTSNRLDDLGKSLGIGRKVKHSGFELWLRCIKGNPKAWDRMRQYNMRDVKLLEKVYWKLLPWMETHPNLAILKGGKGCPKCGTSAVTKNGFRANPKQSIGGFPLRDPKIRLPIESVAPFASDPELTARREIKLLRIEVEQLRAVERMLCAELEVLRAGRDEDRKTKELLFAYVEAVEQLFESRDYPEQEAKPFSGLRSHGWFPW